MKRLSQTYKVKRSIKLESSHKDFLRNPSTKYFLNLKTNKKFSKLKVNNNSKIEKGKLKNKKMRICILCKMMYK